MIADIAVAAVLSGGVAVAAVVTDVPCLLLLFLPFFTHFVRPSLSPVPFTVYVHLVAATDKTLPERN